MTVLQVPDTSGDSPVGRWLHEQKNRLGIPWNELASRAGVSVDALRRLCAGKTIPRAATLRKLIGVCDDGTQATIAIGAWVAQHHEARAVQFRARRAGERAECRVCQKDELVSQARHSRTFRPAMPGQRASFMHRGCRPRPTMSPFVAPLENAKARFGGSWKQLHMIANEGGVRMDLDKLRTGRTIPKSERIRKLASILRFSDQEVDTLVALAERHWEERAALKCSRTRQRTDTRAICRKCKRTAFLSAVRARRTFRASQAGQPATFLHRECRGQPRKLTLSCPHPGCATAARREYKSAAWKKRHAKQRRGRNHYAVLCKRHNLSRQGRRQARRMRQLSFRRFERLFAARYPKGYLGRRSAQEVWDAASTGVPVSLAIIARRIRKDLFSEAYRTSSWAVFHRFQNALKDSRYHHDLSAEDLWTRAKQGDGEALRIRAELLHPEDEAFLRELKPSDPKAFFQRRPENNGSVGKRGAAISKGQVLVRWAGKTRGLTACPLCGLVVHRRRFHPECWDTWRRRPEFQAERERRRWSPEKAARRPIDPPQRPGRPPVKLDQKYGWLMKKAADVPLKDIARAADVTEAAVSIGIQDFKRRLPGAWDRVFSDHGSGSANRAREGIFPLSTLRVSGRESLVGWLARYGMAPNKISRLVGYPVEEVHRMMGTPTAPRR